LALSWQGIGDSRRRIAMRTNDSGMTRVSEIEIEILDRLR